jgi:hypothetical protein
MHFDKKKEGRIENEDREWRLEWNITPWKISITRSLLKSLNLYTTSS